MPEKNLTPDEADLRRAREAARLCEAASADIVSFADRLSAEITPADIAEYDTLIAREAAALSRRVEAFGRLGLGAGSIDRSTSESAIS
jgi:hypothetical protein